MYSGPVECRWCTTPCVPIALGIFLSLWHGGVNKTSVRLNSPRQKRKGGEVGVPWLSKSKLGTCPAFRVIEKALGGAKVPSLESRAPCEQRCWNVILLASLCQLLLVLPYEVMCPHAEQLGNSCGIEERGSRIRKWWIWKDAKALQARCHERFSALSLFSRLLLLLHQYGHKTGKKKEAGK